MSDLDDAARLQSLDPGNMLQAVADFPEQLSRAAAVQAALRRDAPQLAEYVRAAEAREVVVFGMGGSAIGGDYAATWAQQHGIRVSVWRGYGLPRWIGKQHLLVFSSYSGNTEETLSAFDAAPRDSVRVCIATGGELTKRARAADVPCVALPPGLQPRAALGHSLVALLVTLSATGLTPGDVVAGLDAAATAVRAFGSRLGPEVPEASNPAKKLARQWQDRLPFIYTGDACLAAVARRWKGQLHENAKSQAVASELPEMNHNEIMAWSALPDVRRQAHVTFLHDTHDSERVVQRLRLTHELLEAAIDGRISDVMSQGDGVLAHLLTTTHLGDLASVYLAFLNSVDPTPVERIEALKKRLADGS